MVRLWDSSSGTDLAALEGHKNQVNAVIFSPDGQTLASASHDQTVRLGDTAAGKETARLEGHRGVVYAVAISPDGHTLASGNSRTVQSGTLGEVWLWDLATGRAFKTLKIH